MSMNFTNAIDTLKDFANGKLDISYSELWEKLIDKKLSKDEGRKRYYGALSLADLYECEIADKNLQLIRDERNAIKDDYRKIVRFERLEDIITSAIKKLKPLPQYDIQPITQSKNKVGVLQLSDWHYGLSFSHLLNEFNPDEASQRVNRIISKTIEIVQKEDLSKVYVFIQGDLISGNIHNILRLQNQEDLIDQILNVSEILAFELNILSCYCDLNIVLVGGNHERVTPQKEDNLSRENYIKIVEWCLRERLKNNTRIDILHHRDYDSCYLQIYNFHIGIIHGDKDKQGTAPSNLNKIYGVNFDFIFTAHEHHIGYTDNGYCRVIANGSLCGTDVYAKDLRLVSYATQNFSILYDTGELSVLPLFCKDK